MIVPRVIPVLLLSEKSFVKTLRYDDPTYIGDPVNTINLFNAFEADEIVLLDIKATNQAVGPDFQLLEELASECWTPLTYGGGIKSIEHMEKLFVSGIEKVVLGAIAYENPEILSKAIQKFGSQAIVLSLDVHKNWRGKYQVKVGSTGKTVNGSPLEIAMMFQDMGVGEIFLNAIHNDGLMQGYDIDLINAVAPHINIPVIASCGAGVRADLPIPFKSAGASAVAASSLFVFQNENRGVVVNFPDRNELEKLFA